jgi:hypothetical protein
MMNVRGKLFFLKLRHTISAYFQSFVLVHRTEGSSRVMAAVLSIASCMACKQTMAFWGVNLIDAVL